MPYIDRSMGIAFINGFMKDDGRVIRRLDGNSDDVLDLETLTLVPADNEETIWEGKCTLQAFSSKDRDYVIANADEYRKAYSVFIPANVHGPDIGDFLILETCAFNSQLEGVPLRVMSFGTGTHRVYTELWVTDIRPDRERTMP